MMNLPEFHIPDTVTEARAQQESLRARLRLKNDFGALKVIAGVDVGYDNVRGLARAAVVTLSMADMEPIEQVCATVPVAFPYVPGLLSFREIPAILAALARLQHAPDIFMVDGHGIAHPRRMGIAAHLGVLLDMPGFGVAKSRLAGRFEMPGPKKGDTSALMIGKERIGTVLRSRDNVMPLFISPGHRIDIRTATSLTVKCLRGYRLPEPTRLADKLSKCRPARGASHTNEMRAEVQ